MRLALALLLAVTASPAFADSCRLGRSGMSNVFIWRDSDARSEAMKLISDGVYKNNPALVLRLLSCIADPGDHATILDFGFAEHSVIVTDGDNAGCRGVIAGADAPDCRP